MVAQYILFTNILPEAIADFEIMYGDLTEKDYEALKGAENNGLIEASKEF